MTDAFDRQAALDFALTLRRRWADTLYPHVRREYEAASGAHASNGPSGAVAGAGTGARAAAASPAARAVAAAATVHALPTYPWFAWFERGGQKMLWRAVVDAVAAEPAPATPFAPARLELDPELQLPRWYTDWDIHLQPGGVWSRADAGRVYELGAKLVMLGGNDDYEFHRLFTSTAVPERRYRRIVDLGCGFGKSTWSLQQRFPDADVYGVDFAAPCLELAARRAGARGLPITFRQADAAATGLAPGSADLITSTMFVHEVPVEVLPAVFAEAARLLAPGGLLRFLDFQFTGDAFRDLALVEHGARNNEPFLPPMMAADLVAMAREAGLANARWVAFDERGCGALGELRWPARSDWHFPWAVLQAEKPA
jgi:ubiquinone/menaquinone biosynthesis C-methylase UbiE